ncbi:MAG: TetR/AcrR family transcriptional regulator [Deltaproteobacteria bacterium]|nr:TetR/AcrR family transcriptional regulator [Deltaproteobacteria bacterium]
MARKQGNHETKREEIAQAALRAFLRYGIERVAIKDIGFELGCTTGLIQHYFRNKEEILLFAKDFLYGKTVDRAKAAAKGKRGLDKLRAVCHALVPLTDEHVEEGTVLIMFAAYFINKQNWKPFEQNINNAGLLFYMDGLKEMVEDGNLPGDADLKFLEFAFASMVEGMANNIVIPKEKHPPRQLKKMIDQIIDSLLVSNSS